MKECKKRFNQLKPKFLHKPLDEIDFGLGVARSFYEYAAMDNG